MFVPKGAIKNRSAFIQVMGLHQSGIKAFPEPMMLWEAYIHNHAYIPN